LKLKAYYIELSKHLKLKTKSAAQEHGGKLNQCRKLMGRGGGRRKRRWGGGYWGKVCFQGERDLGDQPCSQTDQLDTQTNRASLQRVTFPDDRSYNP